MIFKKFKLPDDHPLTANLNKMLEWIMSEHGQLHFSGRQKGAHYAISDECLPKRITSELPNNCYVSRFDYQSGFNHDLIEKCAENVYREQTGIPKFLTNPVAKTVYPSNGGYLGWHIDNEGGRLYSTWADGESFFRYQHPITKKIITCYDEPGKWIFRIFTFDPKNPLWHAVYAKDVRISVGYRFVTI